METDWSYSGPKNSLNIKFLGGILLGHPGPRRRETQTKTLSKWPFLLFTQGVAGMSRDLGRDVPDLEKLYAGKLWADFSYPSYRPRKKKSLKRLKEETKKRPFSSFCKETPE